MAEDIERLMKHAHDLERRGRKGDAEITYSAASEIARLKLAFTWQPIESAPSSGKILVARTSNGGRYVTEQQADGDWWRYCAAHDPASIGHYLGWMPLPDPPAQGEQRLSTAPAEQVQGQGEK